MYRLGQPETEQQFETYYHLRWQLLRQPWQQPPGSEKDQADATAFHRCVFRHEEMVAVARLHLIDASDAQIRYMAVASQHQRKGLGSLLLHELEQIACEKGCQRILLHAREEAVAFYRQHGYQLQQPSHRLYGSIQHYLMDKLL